MPQMSPLPWLFLMLMFITTLIMFSTQISHSHSPNTPEYKLKEKQEIKNWEW